MFNTTLQDLETSLCLGDWPTGTGKGGVNAGVPPDIKAITSSPEKAKEFVKALFRR